MPSVVLNALHLATLSGGGGGGGGGSNTPKLIICCLVINDVTLLYSGTFTRLMLFC